MLLDRLAEEADGDVGPNKLLESTLTCKAEDGSKKKCKFLDGVLEKLTEWASAEHHGPRAAFCSSQEGPGSGLIQSDCCQSSGPVASPAKTIGSSEPFLWNRCSQESSCFAFSPS